MLGTYHGSRVALRHFLAQGRGKLINIVGRGARGPVAQQNAYGYGLMLTDLVMKPEAVAGYEQQLAPLATVLKMWGEQPEVPAQKLVWLASSASDGRRRVDASSHGTLWMLGGPFRALFNSRKIELQPRTV